MSDTVRDEDENILIYSAPLRQVAEMFVMPADLSGLPAPGWTHISSAPILWHEQRRRGSTAGLATTPARGSDRRNSGSSRWMRLSSGLRS